MEAVGINLGRYAIDSRALFWCHLLLELLLTNPLPLCHTALPLFLQVCFTSISKGEDFRSRGLDLGTLLISHPRHSIHTSICDESGGSDQYLHQSGLDFTSLMQQAHLKLPYMQSLESNIYPKMVILVGGVSIYIYIYIYIYVYITILYHIVCKNIKHH